jgi:hypothetical protein
MNHTWPAQLIHDYGELPIWTATWTEFYVQRSRHCQTYADALALATKFHGEVVLPVSRFAQVKPEKINPHSELLAIAPLD